MTNKTIKSKISVHVSIVEDGVICVIASINGDFLKVEYSQKFGFLHTPLTDDLIKEIEKNIATKIKWNMISLDSSHNVVKYFVEKTIIDVNGEIAYVDDAKS